MESNKLNLDGQLGGLQTELNFYKKALQNYENLEKELVGNEHLRHIYEPSARLLLERAEEDLAIAFKQIANSFSEEVNSVTVAARQTKASAMDITLKTPESSISGFVDIDLLGKALNGFQSLIYSIISPSRGRKKKVVKEAASLLVSAFSPGSFVIRVHEQTNGLIADENMILETTVPIIVDLMEASTDANKLKEVTSSVDLVVVSSYRNLLQTLSGGESGISIKWASPSGKYRDQSLNNRQIKEAITLFNSDRSLTSRMIEVNGTLTMLEKDDNTKRRRFKLTSFEGTTYSGIVDEALPGYFVPTKITALIEEQIELNNTTDEELTKYILLTVEKYNGDSVTE